VDPLVGKCSNEVDASRQETRNQQACDKIHFSTVMFVVLLMLILNVSGCDPMIIIDDAVNLICVRGLHYFCADRFDKVSKSANFVTDCMQKLSEHFNFLSLESALAANFCPPEFCSLRNPGGSSP
jgi:hypothetical protein